MRINCKKVCVEILIIVYNWRVKEIKKKNKSLKKYRAVILRVANISKAKAVCFGFNISPLKGKHKCVKRR